MKLKPYISEAEAERKVDRMVWRRLDTDSAYKNAESAEAQAEREDEITQGAWMDLADRYIID